MGNLAALATNEVLDKVLGANSEMLDVRVAMDQAHEAAWKATEPRTLELSRLLVALLLHCDAEYVAKLSTAGFGEIGIDETRVYSIEDARTFLAGEGLDVDALAKEVEGTFISGFSLRARTPIYRTTTILSAVSAIRFSTLS